MRKISLLTLISAMGISSLVYADDFYISQIITNYLTNAIKHVIDINGEKYIKISRKQV